jgi:DNA-binding protein HU-beta
VRAGAANTLAFHWMRILAPRADSNSIHRGPPTIIRAGDKNRFDGKAKCFRSDLNRSHLFEVHPFWTRSGRGDGRSNDSLPHDLLSQHEPRPDVTGVKRYWAIAGTLEQMTKQQLVEAVSAKTGRETAEVENVLEAALWSIAEALSSNERVDLRGFGSFTVKDKKERQGRNPRTGETITIAAKRDASFKPGKELTEKLILPKTEAKPA